MLGARTLAPWTSGPHGETARDAIRDRLDDIARWTADYLRLAASTDPATWVATHGEPHTRNQLVTDAAPCSSTGSRCGSRPASATCAGCPARATPPWSTMFDLEWRLDEVSQYADWFEAPHAGTESDRVALAGLLHELDREPRHSAHGATRG